MTVIHMDTEITLTLVQKMKVVTETLNTQSRNVLLAIDRSDWLGSSRDELVDQISDNDRNIKSLSDQLALLSEKLRLEIEQWVNEDHNFLPLFIKGVGDDHAIHPSDVTQGHLGNCYFVAALAAIAHTDPDAIKEMITVNPDGTYTVRFFNAVTGKAEYVTVDQNDIPLDSNGNPIYAQFGDNKEIWPAIIEKAYAKWQYEKMPGINDFLGRDEYEAIAGGMPSVAMKQLTGENSRMYVIPKNFTQEKLINALEDGHPIVFGTPDASDNAALYGGNSPLLAKNHAYYITGYDQKTGMVQIRNPWGWHDQGLIEIPYSQLIKGIASISVNKV